MIIDPLLLSSRSCTLIQSAHTRMFRIDVIRQFRVKVGGRSRFSPMRIVLVSIPLLLAPIFLAPGSGNGKPSKYLDASIYPRVLGEREGKRESEKEKRIEREDSMKGEKTANIEGTGKKETSERLEKGRGEEFFPKTVPSPVRFRKATALAGGSKSGAGKLKDRAEENRPAYRDY